MRASSQQFTAVHIQCLKCDTDSPEGYTDTRNNQNRHLLHSERLSFNALLRGTLKTNVYSQKMKYCCHSDTRSQGASDNKDRGTRKMCHSDPVRIKMVTNMYNMVYKGKLGFTNEYDLCVTLGICK